MAIPSKQCLARALVHLSAKRKWKPLRSEVRDAYQPDPNDRGDYYRPLCYNVLKSDGKIMWKPSELLLLRISKVTPSQLNDLLHKP